MSTPIETGIGSSDRQPANVVKLFSRSSDEIRALVAIGRAKARAMKEKEVEAFSQYLDTATYDLEVAGKVQTVPARELYDEMLEVLSEVDMEYLDPRVGASPGHANLQLRILKSMIDDMLAIVDGCIAQMFEKEAN